MEGTVRIGQVAGSLERALIARAQTGDAAAFDVLIRPRIDRLLRLAMSITGSEADGRDAVQDACLHAWRELPRLRDPDRFDAWIARILVNGCRSALRGKRRAQVREIPVDQLTVETEPASGQALAADAVSDQDVIRRAFARLNPDQRSILVLHHVDGQSVTGIGTLLGIPEGTAKWRLHAARTALARAIALETR